MQPSQLGVSTIIVIIVIIIIIIITIIFMISSIINSSKSPNPGRPGTPRGSVRPAPPVALAPGIFSVVEDFGLRV